MKYNAAMGQWTAFERNSDQAAVQAERTDMPRAAVDEVTDPVAVAEALRAAGFLALSVNAAPKFYVPQHARWAVSLDMAARLQYAAHAANMANLNQEEI